MGPRKLRPFEMQKILEVLQHLLVLALVEDQMRVVLCNLAPVQSESELFLQPPIVKFQYLRARDLLNLIREAELLLQYTRHLLKLNQLILQDS